MLPSKSNDRALNRSVIRFNDLFIAILVGFL